MVKQRNFIVAIILSACLGFFGADRFYLGCYLTGILKAITFGGFGIWYVVDFIRLLIGSKLCGGFVWSGSFFNKFGGSLAISNDGTQNDGVIIIVSILIGAVIFYFFFMEKFQRRFFPSTIDQNKETQNPQILTK